MVESVSPGRPCLTLNAEVEHLREIVFEAHAAHIDIGRLDVPVHETTGVGVRERMGDLT